MDKKLFSFVLFIVALKMGCYQNIMAQPGPPKTPSLVIDTTFNSNLNIANEEITAVFIQTNTGKYIVETMEQTLPMPTTKIYRLNPNGTQDTTFHQPVFSRADTLPPPIPYRVAGLFPNGDILVYGRFHKVDNVMRPFLARLDANGNLVTSFNVNFYPYTSPQPGDVSGCNIWKPEVVFNHFRMQSGQNYYVFNHEYPTYTGVNCPSNNINYGFNNAWKINGQTRVGWAAMSVDQVIPTAFNSIYPNPPVNFANTSAVQIKDIVLNQSNEVFAIGVFNGVNGNSRTSVAKLDANGNLSTNFNPVIVYTPDPVPINIEKIKVNPFNGKVMIYGRFDKLNGVSRPTFQGTYALAYLNTNGTLDNIFDPKRTPEFLNLDAFAFTSKEGYFTAIQGNPTKLMSFDKTLPWAFTVSTANDKINVVQWYETPIVTGAPPKAKILIAGKFTTVNGTSAKKIALLKYK